ncbi:maleylpyruvate isomerase N-terminal domain-containing protein [Actinoplanes sp. TRM 88003]|uniref:Maleylpyruvate isomerase N-terminal domain-containing protein n=1 Tax=Paractinoplanes aksuensis TaxID=2939490 RepID=A0ABT1DFX2_9ACTN|nr:maleylpyruvate isomerase N-terminal domain-containing protein [Actinoplanes aksuensis]MCO8269727.1 maleylpyruvate isomerase N-terminal domain-containing protein [Actinoplanes aksuensis]
MDYRRTYRSAAVTFVDLVRRVPADRLDGPGLGDWTLRELISHTISSALEQVPAVLGTASSSAPRSPSLPGAPRKAPQPVNIEAPEGYFAFVRDVPADVYAAAVAASTDDARRPVDFDSTGELAGRATQSLAAVGDDDVVTTPVGGMRVRDWLPTRTFELVVHGADVAAAAGVPAGFDPAAVSEATLLAARIAVALGEGPTVLSALTGRSPLPEKFTVV